MKRRIIAGVLLLAMAVSLLPAQTLAVEISDGVKAQSSYEPASVIDSGSCGENVTWTYDTNCVLTISGTGPMNSYWSYGTPWYGYVDYISKVVVEEGVTTIGSAAFHDCFNMTEAVLPSTVTRIEDRAFSNCGNLRSVNLPDNLTFIGWNAFWWCGSLEKIELPETLVTIENAAFSVCESLTEVTIPASVTQIGEYPFGFCKNLTGIWVDENNPNYSSDSRGALLDKSGKTLIQIPGALMGAYTVPEGVTHIGSCASAGNTGLTDVYFPASLEEIGVSAFKECTGLRSLIMPAGVSLIDGSAFGDCTALQGVVFLGDAPELYYDAFGNVTAKGYYPANNATWTEEYLQINGDDLAFEPLNGLVILSQPQNVQAVPGQSVSVSVEAYGTDLTYEWWVASPGADFAMTDVTGNTYSVTLNSYTVGLQVYCVVTDGAGNKVQSDTAAFGYVAAIEENEQQWAEIDTAGKTIYYSFIPDYSCWYRLQVFGEMDVVIELYDEYMNLLASNEGTLDSCVTSDFYEGGVYFIGLRYANASDWGMVEYSVCHDNSNFRSETTVEATCQTEGQLTNYCNVCAYSWTEAVIGTHNFVDRVCTVCGEEQLLTGTCGDDLTWTLNNEGVLTISGTGAMYDFTLYDFAPWYEYRTSINTLVIEDGVTGIGDYAFYECGGLTSVIIPDGVTAIGQSAFNGCSGITSVSFGADVSSIGEAAFWNCTGLTSVTIPDKVTVVESSVFGNCTNLVSVSIPDGVTTIGDSAFTGCGALKTVNIPESVTIIGGSAFYCTALETVEIPDKVTSIGDRAFAECTALTEVKLGESVVTIGEYAFRYCSNLVSINIPASVTTVGERAFDQCPALTDIYITDLTAWMNISYGSQFSRPLECNENAKNLYLNGVLLTDAVIPEGITSISDYAFYNCGNLRSISLPDSLTSIGDYAFAGCTGLGAVDIPDGVTSIGYSAFERCSSLTSIVIPEGVSAINNATFSYCTGLETVAIPNSVTSIGIEAFGHCTDLTTLTIPDSVVSISEFAFWCCSGLTDITIPASVSSVGAWAFLNCNGLRTVTFLGDAPAIDGTAFSDAVISVFYPADNNTWTADVLQSYGGTITWVPQGAVVVIPSLTLVAPTLNFEDEIYYNIYYTVSDMSNVVEMGLITFDQSTPDGTVENADAVVPGYTQIGSEYMSHSNGIPAKMLGDALYFKAYAKLSDGTYAYSSMAGYHAVAYAKDRLTNSNSAKTHQLVIAMLNYGAAAQVQFNYKTDSLMNSFLTAEQQALVSDYSADMVEGLTAVDSSKAGGFAAVSGSFSYLYPAVSFEGAFSINYYFSPARAMDGDLTLYYWNLEDYNNASVLTKDNATGSVVMEPSTTAGEYLGVVEGIAAKEIDQTVFVAGVYESNGTTYCTGVIAYSLATYCQDRIANGSATMQAFAKATVVYGYYAKAYFA